MHYLWGKQTILSLAVVVARRTGGAVSTAPILFQRVKLLSRLINGRQHWGPRRTECVA